MTPDHQTLMWLSEKYAKFVEEETDLNAKISFAQISAIALEEAKHLRINGRSHRDILNDIEILMFDYATARSRKTEYEVLMEIALLVREKNS